MIGTTVQTVLAQASDPDNVIGWFTDRAGRDGSGAIPDQLWVTLWHSLAAAAVAVVVAVPIATVLAHYRKAELLSGWIVNLGRVIPTVAVLGMATLVSIRNGYGFEPWPILVALTVLAMPPVFANTYTAVRGVDRDVVDAARAMGMSERSVTTRVEMVLGAPIIITGIRVAVVQLVATEGIGAYFGGDGLGTYIFLGLAAGPIEQVQAGAILIAGTAMACDFVLWVTSKLLFRRRGVGSSRRSAGADVQAEPIRSSDRLSTTEATT
jgi:osmoprotectant transport system permease protein